MTSPLKVPQALIFDMDGVLVDSEPLHKRAKQMAFQEAGIHFPEQTYDSYKGRPDTTMFHEVLAGRWTTLRNCSTGSISISKK